LLPPAFNASFRPGQCWLSDSTAGRCRVPIYVMPTDSPLPWHPFPLLLPNRKAMTRDIKDLIVALDIGTSKVVAVVAEILPEGRIEVLGLGQHESQGMRKGVLLNIEPTAKSIQRALEEAELMADCKIREV